MILIKKIKISRTADKKLKELVSILHSENYFATRSSAKDYVKAIYQFCYSIPSKALRAVKNPVFGDCYCAYKANSRTTWYIIYSIKDDVYTVTDILNNHSLNYTSFMEGI